MKWLCNNANNSLEKCSKEAEKALINLGESKGKVLNGSMSQFIKNYDKIKKVNIGEAIDINEMPKFKIEHEDFMRISSTVNDYADILKSGATGAVAGTLISLAASGSLPIVTSGLSTAGSVLAMGNIGAATSIAGSTLSFGVAMTPLAAIAAPVVLFTGFSACLKADERLEKARCERSKVRKAVEEMKVLCLNISN